MRHPYSIGMARAYAVFDNGGFLIDPYLIEKIQDNTGKDLFIANPKIACITCNDIPVIYGETRIKSMVSKMSQK